MRTLLAYGGALLSATVVVTVITSLGLLRSSSRVLQISRQSLQDLRDPGLDDYAKEARLRRNALGLARLWVVLTLGLALAVAAPLPLLWLLERGGVVSIHDVARAALSWQFLTTGAVLILGKLAYDWRAHRGSE